MNIDDSVDWYVEIIVGADVDRGFNRGVDSDLYANIRCSDNAVSKSDFGETVGSMNGNSVDLGVKTGKHGFSVVIGSRGVWCVDRGVGDGNISADKITFGIDDWYDMCSSDGFFDGFLC